MRDQKTDKLKMMELDAETHPVTIIKDRYGGAYSGAKWIAWNCAPEIIPPEVAGDDVSCGAFWKPDDWDFKTENTVQDWTMHLGKGATPQEAYEALLAAKR